MTPYPTMLTALRSMQFVSGKQDVFCLLARTTGSPTEIIGSFTVAQSPKAYIIIILILILLLLLLMIIIIIIIIIIITII